jgi:hypothetical protein
MKTLTMTLALILAAGSASAWQTTNCVETFSGVRCTTSGDGGMIVTNCTNTFSGTRCTTW